MLDCPNQYKAHTAPFHLLGRVNINSWLFVQDEKLTMDKLYVLSRLFPAKIYDLDIKALNPKEQSFQVGKVSMQFFNINLTNSRKKTLLVGYNPINRAIPTQKNTIYTALTLFRLGSLGTIRLGGGTIRNH